MLSMRSDAWPFELVLLYNGGDAVLNWICAVVTYVYQQRGQSVHDECQNYESSEGILRDLYQTYFTSSSSATTTTSSSTSAVNGKALGAHHIHTSWLYCSFSSSSSLPHSTALPTSTILLSEPSVYAVMSPLTLLYRLITCGLVIEAQFYLQNLISLPPLSTLIQTSEGKKGNNGFWAEDHESTAMTCSVTLSDLLSEIKRYRPYLSPHTPRIHNNVDSATTTSNNISNVAIYDEAYIGSICLKILSAYTS